MVKAKCEYCTEAAGIIMILKGFEHHHGSQLTTEHNFEFWSKKRAAHQIQ